jgi:hypothetical protein
MLLQEVIGSASLGGKDEILEDELVICNENSTNGFLYKMFAVLKSVLFFFYSNKGNWEKESEIGSLFIMYSRFVNAVQNLRNITREFPLLFHRRKYKLWLVYYSCFSSIDCILGFRALALFKGLFAGFILQLSLHLFCQS